MKKILLSALAVCLMVVVAVASTDPTLKLGSMTTSGRTSATELSKANRLELQSDQASTPLTIASFEMKVYKADGKLFSRAPIVGSEIPEEMQVVISRLHPGARVVIEDVKIHDSQSGQTKGIGGMTFEII